MLEGARRTGSNALLGAAFAVCAAPCIGTVLASVLVLAGDSDTVVRGSVLLFAYSAGIAAAFVLAGIAFARAMGAFRWLRDHYTVIRVVSGAILVALGLLLFFHRDWWLRVMVNRLLDGGRARGDLEADRLELEGAVGDASVAASTCARTAETSTPRWAGA